MTYEQTLMEHETMAIEKTKAEIVLNMLKRNVPLEDIAFFSGLTVDKVKALIKKTAIPV